MPPQPLAFVAVAAAVDGRDDRVIAPESGFGVARNEPRLRRNNAAPITSSRDNSD
jgi:hypothetical protein